MTTVYKLRIYPDPILHEVSQPVIEFNDNVRDLVDSMKVVMECADGLGLSAVQIGALWRIIVIKQDQTHHVLINPQITERLGEQSFEEGCLSVPGVYEKRLRSKRIHVDYYDQNGEHHLHWFSDVDAFCIQHEIDHLDGKIFIDELSPLKKNRARDKIKKTVRRFQNNLIKQKVY